MSKCCAYQSSRSPAGIFFGYQRSTKPGSDQLAVPMRIFTVSDDLLVTHQRSHRRRRTQMGLLFHFAPIERILFDCTTSISKLFSKCGVEQPGSSSGS